MALATGAWRDRAARSVRIHCSRSATRGAASRWRATRRASTSAPLMARSRSKIASMRLIASSAMGEIGGASLPLRALAAMSASSQNLHLAWLQHSASWMGPGLRPARPRSRRGPGRLDLVYRPVGGCRGAHLVHRQPQRDDGDDRPRDRRDHRIPDARSVGARSSLGDLRRGRPAVLLATGLEHGRATRPGDGRKSTS
jgi:hypothetical protein